MSLINDVINKAKEYVGVTEDPPESRLLRAGSV